MATAEEISDESKSEHDEPEFYEAEEKNPWPYPKAMFDFVGMKKTCQRSLIFFASRPQCRPPCRQYYWTRNICPVERIKIKKKRAKRERQEFTLDDGSESITVNLWGKETRELRGKSEGDFVRVINVKTHHYKDTVSLNSTDYTKILKVKSAPVQNDIAQIIGIANAGGLETELEAQTSSGIARLFVESSLLAKAFGIKLNGDFEESLLEMLPFSANAKIQGNTIIEIEKM